MTNNFGSDVQNRLAEGCAGGQKFMEEVAAIW